MANFDGKKAEAPCGSGLGVEGGSSHACALTGDFVMQAKSDITFTRDSVAPAAGYWYGYCIRIDVFGE